MKQPLQAHEQRAVADFLDRLQRHCPGRVLETMLFGSKARGGSTPELDIDVLIIVDEEDWRLTHAISGLAADISLEYDVFIGPRVIGRERWEGMTKRRSGLYRKIVAEGTAPSSVAT